MSKIEWTGETWNPVVGCTPVSPGCLNCYAATMARRLEGMGKADYAPRAATVDEIAARHAAGVNTRPSIDKTIRIAEVRGGRAVFTGDVRTLEDRLSVPLKRRKPTTWFVNSMSDLFHEAVPFDFVDKVFAVMALCPQHTFQVLTKRPERMAEYLHTPGRNGFIWWEASQIDRRLEDTEVDVPYAMTRANVWLGTSVEDQARADERIPHLLRCPATVRFLSCEPLLGAVDLLLDGECSTWRCPECGSRSVDPDGNTPEDDLNSWHCPNCKADGTPGEDADWKSEIDWVIVGCESIGPRVGRFAEGYEAAARSIIQQCRAAGVPVFHKQMPIKGRKSGDPAEWPEAFRVREMPGVGVSEAQRLEKP